MTKKKMTATTIMVTPPVGKKTKQNKGAKRTRANASVAITVPAAASGILRNPTARIKTDGRSTTLEHCEPIQDISIGSALQVSRLDLIPSTFPWLNAMAQNYSKFKWHFLQLYFIPSCPTTTPGSVALGLTYDDLDTNVSSTTTFNQVAVLNRSVVSPVWGGASGSAYLHRNGNAVPLDAVCVEVDTGKLDKPYYKYITQAQLGTLNQTAPGVAASGMYVPCSYVVAVSNGPSTAVFAGRIFAKYKVELLEPIPATLNA